MRTGMMQATAASIGRAGFHAVEVPIHGIYFKKLVRDLKEDPWALARILAREMPHAVKSCMGGGGFHPFEPPPPRSMVRLFYQRVAALGALNRVQTSCNTHGQIKRLFPWLVPELRELGMKIAFAISYTISPRHTDEYYAQKTREVLAFKPDAIYLKDQGGLLTVDRLRTLLPVILQNAGGISVELHSHCTTGLAPLLYLEALKLGVAILHTAVPPLADGSSQPSVFNIAANARLLGYVPRIDENELRTAAARLTAIAREERLPIGAPLEYDYGQYIHQVPGGVISNLRHQLAEMGMLERLDEVLEESVRVRKELGYPIMITPHSQFVVSQAAINVATGERYKVVIDEVILFAQGAYSEDSGYTWMDENLKDKLLGLPRARELAMRERREATVAEIRARLGANSVSDEEFLLRYIMKGGQEIEAMRAAGAPRQYSGASLPVVTLLKELGKQKSLRYVHIRRGPDALALENRSPSRGIH